jgi:hypothetical protein
MKLSSPSKPNRPPDLVIGDNISCFWWEERVNCCDGLFTYFNPDTMTYCDGDKWVVFNRGFIEKHGYTFKESYTSWLLEKELGL